MISLVVNENIQVRSVEWISKIQDYNIVDTVHFFLRKRSILLFTAIVETKVSEWFFILIFDLQIQET